MDLEELLRSDGLVKKLTEHLHLVALLLHSHVPNRPSKVVIQVLLHAQLLDYLCSDNGLSDAV